MSIALPDCRHWEGRFHLSAEEKRELLQRIAKEGPGAIEAFIAEKSAQDGSIAARVAAWRKSLLERAEAMKRALEDQFATRRREEMEALAQREAALHGARESTEAQLRDFRLHRDDRLAEVLQRSELVQVALHGDVARPTLLQRLRNALARLWVRLLELLGIRKKATSRRRLFAAIPAAGRLGLDLGRFEAALYSPAMRARVRSRLQGMSTRQRLREAWQKLLGRSDYEAIAAALMEDELKRQVEEQERSLDQQEKAMAERLAELAEQESKARDRERDALSRLDRERDEAVRTLREKAEAEPLRKMHEQVKEELQMTGYLREGTQGAAVITERLVERFSEMVFEAEMKALPSHYRAAYGSYVEGEGVFRKEPLLSVDELGHMDLVGSLVQARQRHPHQRHLYEDDVLVYREMRASSTHVVLIFDTSGSMEENQRLDAAKRAALALYQAARRDRKGNRVDLVLMETSVRRADILDAWSAQPRGFTNTGGALALARELLATSRADRKLLYLITDGLPEAMTLPDGTDIASYPDKCLDYALQQARTLKAIPGLGFAILLLEAQDEMYVKAAQRIADVLDGKVMPTDPRELARKVLVDYDAQRRAARKAEAPRTQ